MRRHRAAMLVAAALIVAGALPPATPAQTVSSTGVDTHAFGLSAADIGFSGPDAFGTPAALAGSPYGSPFAGPGRYATCGGSVSAFLFMFGSAPGRSSYGWYSDPWDVRFSRNWLTPWPPAYGFWAHHYGFGYGSRIGSYGYNPWNPWSSVRTGCGGSGFGYGFSYWGAGGSYYPIGRYWGTPYGPTWGRDYYPGSWRSFTPAGPPRYVDRGLSRAKPSVAPRSDPDRSASLGAERPGTRVIESRPATGGADLRKVDPRRRAVALEDLAETPGGTATGAPQRLQPGSSPGTTPRGPEARPRAAQPRATPPRATQPRATPPRATQPRATPPRATQPRATQPRATQTRPRATPRVFKRPAPSARRSPETRRAPPPPSKTDSKGRTRQ